MLTAQIHDSAVIEENVLSGRLDRLKNMPIWARLKFADVLPKTYYFADEQDKLVVKLPEIFFYGFERVGDVIWVWYSVNESGSWRNYGATLLKDNSELVLGDY